MGCDGWGVEVAGSAIPLVVYSRVGLMDVWMMILICLDDVFSLPLDILPCIAPAPLPTREQSFHWNVAPCCLWFLDRCLLWYPCPH